MSKDNLIGRTERLEKARADYIAALKNRLKDDPWFDEQLARNPQWTEMIASNFKPPGFDDDLENVVDKG